MSYQIWDNNNLPKDLFEVYQNSLQIRLHQDWEKIKFTKGKSEKFENFSYTECYSTRFELYYLHQHLNLKKFEKYDKTNNTALFAENCIEEIFQKNALNFMNQNIVKNSQYAIKLSPFAKKLFNKKGNDTFEPDGYCDNFGGFYIESKMLGFASGGSATEKLCSIVEKTNHYNQKPTLLVFSGEHEVDEPWANMYFAAVGILGNNDQERINNQNLYINNSLFAKIYYDLSNKKMLYVCKLSKLESFLQKCMINNQMSQSYAI